jgi:hypothetical protein
VSCLKPVQSTATLPAQPRPHPKATEGAVSPAYAHHSPRRATGHPGRWPVNGGTAAKEKCSLRLRRIGVARFVQQRTC